MIKTIPIPEHLAKRPRWRGLPIPVIAMMKPDGDPDFRLTDALERMRVIHGRCCQLCGVALGRNVFFVGGPQSVTELAVKLVHENAPGMKIIHRPNPT